MTLIEKLKIIVASFGKTETSRRLGMWPLTFAKKCSNTDLFKVGEMDEIEKLYEESKNLPIK